jgi:hypothetical protein
MRTEPSCGVVERRSGEGEGGGGRGEGGGRSKEGKPCTRHATEREKKCGFRRLLNMLNQKEEEKRVEEQCNQANIEMGCGARLAG